VLSRLLTTDRALAQLVELTVRIPQTPSTVEAHLFGVGIASAEGAVANAATRAKRSEPEANTLRTLRTDENETRVIRTPKTDLRYNIPL